jgi:Ni2+-binding GTPase involved in maturation of urease and hydrogenase
MAVVVVGGGGRGAGKTALVCGVIAALPERKWMAVKIAGHTHGAEQRVYEESEPGEGKDTARYLAAGARRAFLLTADDDEGMRAALNGLSQLIERGDDLIIESNRALNFLTPDVCMVVRAGSDAAEEKASFGTAISVADAVVVGCSADGFRDGLLPEFELARLERISPVLERWIRGRLERT